ncbi:MAG: GNAT family N-acetyltransferase [bacterium]|nr:GNAT family N-acetyltransferase [bacterium]
MAFIETERLLLRTWMPSDAAAWLAIAAQPDVARYLPGVAEPTRSDVEAWLARQMEEEEREGFSCWPVVRKADGALVGRCGLHRMADGDVEIAWAFDRNVWGAGYATEAARAALAFARDERHLARVVALVDPRNARSIGVTHRLGMRFDRVVRAYRRDLLRYIA